LGEQVSLGAIVGIVQQAGERAQHTPTTQRAIALDELYSQRSEAYLNVVDVHSAAVWATTSPVAVDGESWTLVLWEMQEQGLRWQTMVSDGGKAIGEAMQTVAPTLLAQRDVWHVLHACQQVQGRLDRLVDQLQEQAKTVARQAERLAKGQKPRGAHPMSDVVTHAARLRQARYVANSLRYLSSELRRLLDVVVLAPAKQGVLSSQQRGEELEVLLAVLAVWHNHRVAPRGLHQGQSPLQRSGFSAVESDWLVALGYPPATGDASTCHLVTLEQEEALVA
jgi:hypothetical protein